MGEYEFKLFSNVRDVKELGHGNRVFGVIDVVIGVVREYLAL